MKKIMFLIGCVILVLGCKLGKKDLSKSEHGGSEQIVIPVNEKVNLQMETPQKEKNIVFKRKNHEVRNIYFNKLKEINNRKVLFESKNYLILTEYSNQKGGEELFFIAKKKD